MSSFYETITAAVNDVTANGFDTQKRIDDWIIKIRRAALDSLVSQDVVERQVASTLKNIYSRMVVKGKILQYHQGIGLFDVNMVKPKLRNELDRRIMANAQLIKLNREQAVTVTLRRFSGWATSVPAGGSRVVEKQEEKASIRKALAQLPFEERRVAIDQGHKFVSSLNDLIASERGALAGVWHSHWRQPGYRYRKDHKERDELYYAIRGNWALEKGLMKVGPAGYTDQITQPGEEVFCRCQYQYVYNLMSLPDFMLTVKGRAEIQRVTA